MTNEQIVAQIRNGENVKENMLQLYQQNKGYIYKLAVKFSGYAELEDLLQESYIALHEAVQRYDPERETKFLTCATFWIRQQLQRYVENVGGVVRVPAGVQGNVRRLKKLTNEYRKYYGCEATDLEIRQYLGMSQEELDKTKEAAKWGNITSLSALVGEEKDNSLSDMIASDQNVEEDVIKKLDTAAMKKELWVAVDNLPGNLPEIIRKRYLDKMTIEQVGSSCGVTKWKARSGEYKALRELRKPSNSRKFRRYYEQYITVAPIHTVSVERFQNTWTSATELDALNELHWKIEGL